MFPDARSTRRLAARPRKSRSRFHPQFEALECRCLMAGDPVLYWNDVALEAVKNDFALGHATEQPGPTGSARALAMVHTAIYDAVMAIDRSDAPFLWNSFASPGMSMDAAIGAAAHDTLSALFPSQQPMFDAALDEAMAGKPQKQIKSGLEMGHKIAVKMMASREDDGSGDPMGFTPGTQPGEWRPDPTHPDQLAWGPGWGHVDPFIMDASAHFAAPPIPDMTSQEYTDAFNEAKALGGDGVTTPTSRTPEQTTIGIFWGYDGTPGMGTPPRMYNQATRVIAQQMHNSVVDNARLFALVNLALVDAGIAAWDTKYVENFWRPVTAIREADPGTGPTGLGDGNPDTHVDPTWTPLGAPNDNGGGTNFTPPFPAYTSGHAAFGAAAFTAIGRFYGTDDIAFTLGSDEFNGITQDQNGVVRPVVTRSYNSLGEAIVENGISRIYLGIHWKFDMVEGIAQGTAVGNYIADHFGRRRSLFGNFPHIGEHIRENIERLRESIDRLRDTIEQIFSEWHFLNDIEHLAQTTPAAQPAALIQAPGTSVGAKNRSAGAPLFDLSSRQPADDLPGLENLLPSIGIRGRR